MQNTSDRTVTRVRHTLKFRLLQVLRVHTVTPHLLRVTLGGPDLADFESASFDDHVKVFFPPPGAERPVLPTLGANGPEFPEGEPKPDARDFTPRRFDRAAGELDLEFVLNHPARVALGRPGTCRPMARHRRPARFVRRPDRFRLAPADRRRYGAAGDRAASRGIAGRRARSRRDGSRGSHRADRVRHARRRA